MAMDYNYLPSGNVCFNADSPEENSSSWDPSHCFFRSLLPGEGTVNSLITLFAVLSCLSWVVNGYMFYGIFRSEELSWQPRFILLKNLALNDLLLTTTFVPTILHCLISRQTLSFGIWCLAQYSIGTMCVFCAIYTLTLMALERYLYICHAIQYINILTPRRLKLGIALAWGVSASMSAVYLILLLTGHGSFGMPTTGLLCEPDIVEKHMNFPLAAAAFRKACGMASFLVCILTCAFSYFRIYGEAKNAVEPFNQTNSRARRTVLFYISMFFLQLVPYWLKVVTDVFWELNSQPLRQQGNAGLLHIALLLLLFVPPCVNPLIYGLRNKEVRRTMLLATCRIHLPRSPGMAA
nr:PREDICTED: olfactory receptor 1G1-like [Lepisosteus oculatus]